MKHSVYLTDDQWKMLQDESGLKNPASFVRQIIERYLRDNLQAKANAAFEELGRAARSSQPKLAELPGPSEALRERWWALGIRVRWHDKFLKQAFAWYVNKYGSEEEALQDLEHRHEHEQLHTPAAWLVRAYRDQLDENGHDFQP